MAFDLYATQASITAYLREQFPQYVFEENTLPEDTPVPRQGEEVNPFFLIQYGNMTRRPKGASFYGARNDDYYSWCQVIAIGSVDFQIRAALSLIVDRLIGFKPVGGNRLLPDGGPADYGSRQYSVRPVLYYSSQRFEYGLNQNGLDGYLSA